MAKSYYSVEGSSLSLTNGDEAYLPATIAKPLDLEHF